VSGFVNMTKTYVNQDSGHYQACAQVMASRVLDRQDRIREQDEYTGHDTNDRDPFGGRVDSIETYFTR